MLPLWVAAAELLSTTRSPDAMRSFSSHDDIREGSIHYDPNCLKSLEALRQWHPEVMNEVLGIEEMCNSLHVVFILEDARKFSDDLLISLFLHRQALPRLHIRFGFMSAP
jgi:hypothetical protein